MKFVLVLLTWCLVVLMVFSQSNKIKDLENQRKLTLRDIENTTLLLNETKKNTSTLLNRISLLAAQISSRQQLIALLNSEMAAIAEQEAATEKEIALLTASLQGQQKSYARAIESMVLRKHTGNKLLFVLSGKSLAESFRRMKYLKDYSEWRSNQIDEIKEKQKTLQEKKAFIEKTRAEKKILLGNREKEQNNLKQEEETHQQEVSEATQKQKELQANLQLKQRQANNLNSQIEKLIAQEVARQEQEAKRLAEEAARRERMKREAAEKVKEKNTKPTKKSKNTKGSNNTKTSSPTQNVAVATPTVTGENVKLSSNFASNKGRLPMPVTGSYTIVGRFGMQQHNRWKVTTNNNGIDIQARAGAQSRAVYAGEVSRIVAFPGFNNCIIIRHGGYYSFYGNIQQIFVKQGQKIAAGESIGTIYTDPDTGKSLLHFQLWQGTNKLNPEPWLQK